jgi:hypothetical protein
MTYSSKWMTGGTSFVARTPENTSLNRTANTSPRFSPAPIPRTENGLRPVQFDQQRRRSTPNFGNSSAEEIAVDLNDELDQLSNLCAEIVSERRWEPALLRLFHDVPAGEWVPLRDLTGLIEYPATLTASWVKTPDADFVLVLFFDSETLWSMHADYNLARLLRSQSIAAVASA